MADQIYRVLTVYDADTSKAEKGYSNLVITLGDLIGLADRAKGMIKHIIEMQSAAETSKIAIAGMFSAAGMPGANNFQTSLQMSADIITKMRRDARELPGTFEDLQNVFQMSILGGGEAGKSVSQIEQMSANVMAVSKSLKIDSETAGREMAMMMEGRAGSHNILFQRIRGMMSAGMDPEKFNKMAAPEKWKEIEKALSKFGPMIKEYAGTWEALSSSTVDYAQNLQRIATSAFFTSLKGTLQELNAWYEKNQDTLEAFAKNFGEKLGSVFKYVKDIFAWVIEHKDMLMPLAGATAFSAVGGAGGLLGKQFGGGAGNALEMAQGAALEVAIAKMTTDISDVSPTLETFRLGIAGAEGALSQLNGPIGDVVKLLKMFHRGLEWAFNKLDEGQQERFNKEGETKAFASNFAMGQVHNRAAVLQYMKEWEMFTPQGQLKPHGILNAIGTKTTLDPEQAETRQIYTAMKNLVETMTPTEIDKVRKKHFWEVGGVDPREGMVPEMLRKPEAPGKGKDNNLNVAVHIEQTINTEGDPDRLLIATRKAMQEALHRPLLTFRKHVTAA